MLLTDSTLFCIALVLRFFFTEQTKINRNNEQYLCFYCINHLFIHEKEGTIVCLLGGKQPPPKSTLAVN